MDRTLTIPDTLYTRLQDMARKRGLNSVEQLLEALPVEEANLAQRQEAVHLMDTLRERLIATYGEMADSTALLRDDRAR